MRAEFNKEIELLKSLSPNDLYQEFHRIQFEVLAPQYELHIKQIVKDWNRDKVKEIFGPRSPIVSELNTLITLNEIKSSKGKEQLLLQNVLAFIDDPIEALALARECGIKKIILQDLPKDRSFKYESIPEIEFFANRHLSTYADHLNAGNPVLNNVVNHCESVGFEIESDTVLDFNYTTKFQKLSIVKMEIALDLIEHKFADVVSMYDQIKPQLEEWFFCPNSWLKVKGCSRWLVLNTKHE